MKTYLTGVLNFGKLSNVSHAIGDLRPFVTEAIEIRSSHMLRKCRENTGLTVLGLLQSVQ